MKKFLTIFLSLVFVTSLSVTAFAETIDETTEGSSGQVEVVYGVENAYVVTIPADITLIAKESSPIEISASDVVIRYGNQLTVMIGSANYDSDSKKWYLVDTENESNKLNYTIKADKTDVVSGETILTVAAGTAEVTNVTLTAELAEAASVVAAYKDTITFRVSVEPPQQ